MMALAVVQIASEGCGPRIRCQSPANDKSELITVNRKHIVQSTYQRRLEAYYSVEMVALAVARDSQRGVEG